MSPDSHIDAATLFGLPPGAVSAQRVAKTTLVAPWVDDRAAAKVIDRAVSEAHLVGILRPETIAVPAFRDDAREVTDIPVLLVALATSQPPAVSRLAELLHRGMPRLLVLLLSATLGTESLDATRALRFDSSSTELSLALTRPSKTDSTGATSVIEHALRVPVAPLTHGALHMNRLNTANLWTLYCDLVGAAATEGRMPPAHVDAAEAVRLHYELARAQTKLATIAREAVTVRSLQRRIDLNEEATHLRAALQEMTHTLYGVSKP